MGVLAGCWGGLVVTDPDYRDTSARRGRDGVEEVGGHTGLTAEPAEVDLYALDAVHRVDLTIGNAGFASLRVSPYEFVAASVLFDGEEIPDAAVRVKGRLGSYRSIDGKPALKLDLNALGGTGEIAGRKAYNLNNMVQDCAMMHERVAYAVYRAAGVPAPRVGYAWVTVDGADYGLYSLVEEYDKDFLGTWYEDDGGNLYDADYHLWPDGSYTLLDFTAATQDLIELDAGTDVGRADLHAVTEAVAATAGTDGFDAAVGALVDLQEFTRMWAVDTWVGHYDSYDFNINNYRIYFDPSDGRADLFPWDPDWAFYATTPIDSPASALPLGCRADPACYARYRQALAEVVAAADALDLPTDIAAADALTLDLVVADPRKEYSVGSVVSCRAELDAWVRRRSAEIQAWAGL